MIRHDGHYTIFKIQHRTNDPRKEWAYSNFDHFGYPPGFNASGRCWQETGEHGVFTEEEALNGLFHISENNPSHEFRVVMVEVSQTTTPVQFNPVLAHRKLIEAQTKLKEVEEAFSRMSDAQADLLIRQASNSSRMLIKDAWTSVNGSYTDAFITVTKYLGN